MTTKRKSSKPTAPAVAKETPLEQYYRECSDDMSWHGQVDRNGWICGISDSSEPPTREDLIAGWMAVAIVEVRTIDGKTVKSPPFHLSRAQAERKVDGPHGVPVVPSPLLWDGWEDFKREEASEPVPVVEEAA